MNCKYIDVQKYLQTDSLFSREDIDKCIASQDMIDDFITNGKYICVEGLDFIIEGYCQNGIFMLTNITKKAR